MLYWMQHPFQPRWHTPLWLGLNLVPWIRTECSDSWTVPACALFHESYRFFDNLRRIRETSRFRLRFIFRVPFSMQVKQTLKSQVKPSWKTNLHGYTALTASPQQSQNRCFMTSTLRSKRWHILKGKFLAQKCWENWCICEYGYIMMREVCTRAGFSWWLAES